MSRNQSNPKKQIPMFYVLLIIFLTHVSPLLGEKHIAGITPEITTQDYNNFRSCSERVMIIGIKLEKNIPHITSIRIQPGQLNNNRFDSQTIPNLAESETPSLFIYDSLRNLIFFAYFDYPQFKTVPPLPFGFEGHFYPDVIYIEKPEVYLVVPYLENVEFIEIYNPYETFPAAIEKFDELNVFYETKNDSVTFMSKPTLAEKNRFHIIIIASGYDTWNMNAFRNKAEQTKNYIRSKEPFISSSSAISVHIYENLVDLGCYCGCAGIDRLMCCNSQKVISQAVSSGFLFDEIIVIHNTITYCGGGYREISDAYKVNSYNTYSMAYCGNWMAEMVLHEFGHSFGNLCDEYEYTTEGYNYSLCVNCRDNCNDWSSISNACQQGCDARRDYYRPENSIMLSLSIPYYNSVSIYSTYLPDGLLKRLRYFTSIENLPPEFDSIIGTIEGREGDLICFNATATDPDGDEIIYSAENLPTGASLNSTIADFSWKPSYTQAGTYFVTVKASDRQTTISQVVKIIVKNVKVIKK